jgi:hypothetical protein
VRKAVGFLAARLEMWLASNAGWAVQRQRRELSERKTTQGLSTCEFLLWGQALRARYWISNTKSRPKLSKGAFRHSKNGASLWVRHQIERKTHLIWR